MKQIAALFVRDDSIYKTLPGVDAWDKDRNALNWPGGCPGIFHPPCRGWGKLRHFAKPVPGELELATWSVNQVRLYGGVLEHPYGSLLWKEKQLPAPGSIDDHGGMTLIVDQDWFGHRAQKTTLLYIVGLLPRLIPPFPLKLEDPSHVVSPWRGLRAGMPGYRPQLRKAEREHTPPLFALWLCDIARSAKI